MQAFWPLCALSQRRVSESNQTMKKFMKDKIKNN
jgi:hypothetical protein